jgi:hypothetical protein
MPETTYLPQARCEISEGLTGSDKTIRVRDVDGRRQYIHVLPSLVNWVSDTPYLPVGVINVDYRNNRVLIGVAYRGGFRREPDVDADRRLPGRVGSACMRSDEWLAT